MKGSSSGGIEFGAGALCSFWALCWAVYFEAPFDYFGKAGIKWQEEQKVQLGHVAKKCDCVFLSRLAFVGFLLTSCLAYCSVATQLTLSILLLNMEQLHLCISNSCGFAAPAIQQTETRWNWLLISTIISWWHAAFQNNLICSNSVNF